MNLEGTLSSRLWAEVKSNYEARNYTSAILDAVHFLSELIRQKTNLEADGVSLAGQAFGGKTPRLKVNKLQTESDWNVQQGTEQILRGVYQSIRNPRSHEKYNDSQGDAEAIILFIDYLLRIIDQSKAPFSKASFLPRVFDPAFVENSRYASLLVQEIPPKQRLAVFIDIYQKRDSGDCGKLKWFTHELFKTLPTEEQDQVLELVSDELKSTDNDGKIKTVVQVLPSECWPRLSEVARLRIENKFYRSAEEGQYNAATKKCSAGWLATWSTGVLEHFSSKRELASCLTRKMASGSNLDQDYVLQFFLSHFEKLAPKPTPFFIQTIKQRLKEGDKRFFDAFGPFMFTADYEAPFETELKEFKEQPQGEAPASITEADDVPF